MKPFTLFFGASGQVGTSDVTHDSQYKLVVNTVDQLRDHLLKEEVLRQPFLHIFRNCYNDDTNFPQHLEPCTPVADQVSNMAKIQEIRSHPPTDNDVVDFLTNSFPDLYMAPGDFGPEGVDWGKTFSGQGEADKEKIAIDVQLVHLWLQAVSTVDVQCELLIKSLSQVQTPMLSRLWFMFIAVFLHELAHSSLVWYGMGACDSPQLSGIERESGGYIEKAFFGGISCAEFELEPMHLVDIGIERGQVFYPIGESQSLMPVTQY